MEEPRANAVLVLLVGIPASGKSSLAEQYMRSESEIAGLEATVHVVSYDDLFDELASGSIAAAEADVAEDGAVFDPATWPDSRREALGIGLKRCSGDALVIVSFLYITGSTV